MKTLLNPIPKGLEATPIPDHHFPLEIEARIVSKRIAQQMFDAGSCTRFLNSSISKAVDLDEIEDLTFISEIGASNPYDLRTATSEFFREQPQKI